MKHFAKPFLVSAALCVAAVLPVHAEMDVARLKAAIEASVDAEASVVVGHRVLRARLCSRRQSSTLPWSPERRTSGTDQPRNSAGLV